MITILCSGTRGDVQPYVALAQQLKRLGVPVRIAATQDFESFVREYGVDYYPVKVEPESVGPEVTQRAKLLGSAIAAEAGAHDAAQLIASTVGARP